MLKGAESLKIRILGAVLLICGYGCVPAEAAVEVIDGDSLIVDGTEVRLNGIDAPEYHQECFDGKERAYACGKKAYLALQALAGPDTKCREVTVDRYHRSVAVCRSRGKVINEEMVLRGWAVAYTQYTDEFAGAERAAKEARRGIWQGRFMAPELYRALNRQ